MSHPEKSNPAVPPQADAEFLKGEARRRFLGELAVATRHLVDPGEITATSARLLAEHIGSDRCAYATVRDESVFEITGDYCRGVPSIVGEWPVAAFGAECERAMLANEPYVIDDVELDPRAGADLQAYRATTIRSVICLPLHKAGKFTAAMAVHQKTPRQWSTHEIELVRAVVERCWESLERSHAQSALQATADRLGLALGAAQLGDWSWNVGTDVVSLSDRAADIFGLPRGSRPTWQEMRELLHPEDRSRARLAVEKAVLERGQYDIEYRVIHPDGHESWVSAKGRAQYDALGVAAGMFGVIQDITQRKHLEQNLRAQAKQLAEADRKKDDFIALLAHELRNPLAPIRTGLEVIRLGKDKPELVDKVRDMMERQLTHMVRLVDDLLDISRITRDKLSLRFEPVILSQLIAQVFESASPMLEEGGFSLKVSLPEDPVVVQGDFTRLAQVLGNLLANSVKFTPRGGLIEIEATTSEDRLTIAVRDNGIGLPEADLARVFEMFVQAEAPSGLPRSGLGIGLALVKTLVEMHGGTVQAKSPGTGKGSTFAVSLPLAPFGTGGGLAAPPKQGSLFAGRTILIADDNEDAATALESMLSLLGSTVHVVGDGRRAVDFAEKIRPDIILMDVGMPVLDGLRATRKIRSRTWGSSPVILALTGWGREENREDSHQAGCDGHLVKPVALADIETALKATQGKRG